MSGAVRRGSRRVGLQWKNLMEWQGRRTRPLPKRIPRNLHVEIPESKEYYDTGSMKMGVGLVVVAVLAKLTMMYDESQAEERIERRARENTEFQIGGPQIVSRELWDELQEIRPRTPFESRIARDNARIRTGDAVSFEDAKDWVTDVITEAFTRKDDSLSR